MDIPIACLALILAEAAGGVRLEELHLHVNLRNVVSRRMARFEHTIRSDGVGQRLAAELHPQALRTPLHSRRTRVVPDGFATKEGDGFFHRAMITQPARARFGSP